LQSGFPFKPDDPMNNTYPYFAVSRRLIKISLVSLLFILVACRDYHCDWKWEYEQLEEKPKYRNITGTYEITEVSQEFIADHELKNQYYKIILEGNGRYKIIGKPYQVKDATTETEIKKGKWSFTFSRSFGCMIVLQNVAVFPLHTRQGKLALLAEIEGDKCSGLVYEKEIKK